VTKRKVLIPLDGSEFSRQIVRVVKSFFAPEDVSIILFRAVYPPTVPEEVRPHDLLVSQAALGGAYGSYSRSMDNEFLNMARERETFRDEIQESLRREAERLIQDGYQVTTEVHFGDAAQRIVDFVNDTDIDLVAMATHGRTGLGRLVLGSVAERVLRSVATPVLLMRTAVEETRERSPGEKLAQHLGDSHQLRMVAATDGSTLAQRGLTRALELAQALHGRLTILVTVSDRDGAAHAQKVMGEVYELVAELSPRPEIVPLVGYADELILQYLAKHPVDLLCMGAFQDRGAGSTTAIGPTAQRLVQHAPTSVMMYKTARPALRKILACVAVDDTTVIDVAAQLSKAHNASLHVLHVIPPAAATYLSSLAFSEVEAASPLELQDVLAQNTHLSSILQGWIEQLEAQEIMQDVIRLTRGTVPEAILKTAHDGMYDLIIVGSQSGYGHFLGSVANSVVRYAEQSVLVVRTRAAN
jgi:nucleotide-binding universal stress UspA family protein